MTQKEIIAELTTRFTREGILNCAKDDNVNPHHFLTMFIYDIYGIQEGEACRIATEILKFFNINNEKLIKIN